MIWPHNTGSFSGKTNSACGGSPGVETPGDPTTPRAIDDEELFVVEGSKNSTSGVNRQLRKSAKYKGLKGKTVQISM